MNQFSKKLSVVLVCTLVAMAGCSKKPKRPAPSDTVLGQGGAGGAGGASLAPSDAGNIGDASAPGLSQREGVIEDENTIRGLLQPVYFDFNKSAIKEPERAKLQAAKDYLDKNPQYRLLLEGHTDWRGTAEYNLGLGDRRANASKSYLQKLGVGAAKLETVSKGDLEAKQKGTEEDMAKDRRVDLVILKK